MIDAVVVVLKAFARPSSVTFLVAVLGIGVVLSFVKRTQRYARWYFAALFAGYWMFTTPACAERLIVWTSGSYPPVTTASDARGARVVVVLGAGNETVKARGLSISFVTWTAALRVLEGARLYRLLDGPMVIVSGGLTGRDEGDIAEAESLRRAAIELGIPSDHVLMENESHTTREGAQVVARMLGDRAREPIVLVTSPTHMHRSLAVFRAAGMDPIPSVAVFKSDHSLERLRWLPNDVGLRLANAVVYDVAAGWYYWWKGWLK